MENGYNEVKDLPDDWWRYTSTCGVLSKWFIHHLLPLLISAKRDDEVHHMICTGFLLYHRDILSWVTAGHVVDRIEEILSTPSVDILRMRWLDGCEIRGAESVPVGHNLSAFSAYESGIDFGIVAIPDLEALNIIEGGRVKFLTEEVWKNLHLAKPEGYYVFGYPREWVEVQEDRLAGNQILGSLQANLACLPVKRIEYPGPNPVRSEFWNDPDAFYGEILPFADKPAYQPDSIKGMSGGPLFSIERDPDGRIRYRLFGIQSSWLPSERKIRAEPISKIIGMMEG